METIAEQYGRQYDLYCEFTERMQALLTILLKKQNLHIHTISGRAKKKDSLTEKICRKGDKYRSLDEITDLAGLRIITYYEDEVNAVAQLIQNEFSIDMACSVDKRADLMASEQFGYLSLHLVVTLTPERAGLPEYEAFRSLKLEIQIRSLLQHAWAEIEHDLEYKRKDQVPYDVRRHFSRLAGLLEFADSEFGRVRRHLTHMSQTTDIPEGESFSLRALPAKPTVVWRVRNLLPSGWAACGILAVVAASIFCDLYLGIKIARLASNISQLLINV